MSLTSMPYLTIQELDENGAPYAGAKMFFYAAGTTTKQDTYSNAAGSSANTNPVILDAAGRATVFFQPLTYDVVLAPSTDTDPPASPIWTRSGIVAVPASSADLDIAGTAGESLSAGNAVVLSDGSGSKTAGKWYKADADFTYLSTLAPQIGMVQDSIASGASGSIRIGGRITGLSALTEGTLYYISATAGALTASAPANAMPIAVADSTTSVILQPPARTATASIAGIVSTTTQSFGGNKTFANNVTISGTEDVTGQATFAIPPKFYPGATSTASIIVNGLISSSGATYTETGSGLETAYSFTLKGNTLNVDGKCLRIKFWGLGANTANAKAINVVLGSTSITIFNSTIQNVPLLGEVLIIRTGASAQRVVGVRSPDGGSTTNLVVHSEAFAETLANDLTLAIKLQGGAASDIILYGYTAETLG